jgi:hypothetical protein
VRENEAISAIIEASFGRHEVSHFRQDLATMKATTHLVFDCDSIYSNCFGRYTELGRKCSRFIWPVLTSSDKLQKSETAGLSLATKAPLATVKSAFKRCVMFPTMEFWHSVLLSQIS